MQKPTNLNLKIENLIRDLNILTSRVPAPQFWLDLRLTILLCFLFCEELVNILCRHKTIIIDKFKEKTKLLQKQGVIPQTLKTDLDELYSVRNAIAHNLKIIGKISSVNQAYLDVDTAKSKGINCLIGLLRAIDAEESKENPI